tara:strand:- start:67 stop:525 length:459 start_codon:yes stop_codon:yes gene_type:complete
MQFSVKPMTLKMVNEFVKQNHRHNKKVTGHRFSIGAEYDSKLVGVAICGRPVARKLDTDDTLEITRLCVIENAPKNLCSFLYARCCQIWRLMGGKKVITYTLETEKGASLRASNFKHVSTTKYGNNIGWHTRKGRVRQNTEKINKLRWEYQL